jgi:hypothetical protein
MRRLSDLPPRLACDHCGAYHTLGVTDGQLCPLCGRGRLRPVEDVPDPHRDHQRPATTSSGVPGTASTCSPAPSASSRWCESVTSANATFPET